MGDTRRLEEISLWYYYKTKVWSQNSPQASVVHNIMRTLRSVHNTKKLAYMSSPITTGKYFYEQVLSHTRHSKWVDSEENKAIEKRVREQVFIHNYNEGCSFLSGLESRLDYPIIFPGDLIPARQEWEQAHFQALWLSIIAEISTEVHMNKDWEYSNGCCEEFVHVYQLKLGLPRHRQILFFNTKQTEEENRERMRNMLVYDFRGEKISLEDGLRAMKKSIEWIKTAGFKTDKIERCKNLLEKTGELIEQGFYQ